MRTGAGLTCLSITLRRQGGGSQRELEELLNKAETTFTHPHPTSTGGRRFKNLSDSSHKCSYGLLIHFRRKTEVFLNLTA